MSYSDKPWLKSYKAGPFKLKHTMEPYPEINVYKFLEDSATKYPDNIACIYRDEELTYKDLKDKVDKFASGLANLGVKKGSYVATIIPNSPKFIICDFGILKLGAIHVPISVLHNADTIIHELNESGAETVISSYRRLDRVIELKDKTKLKNIIFTTIPVYPDYTLPKIDKNFISGCHKLEDLIEESEPHSQEIEINPKEDLALLPFTGGTTGLPKGTMLTHFNVTSNIRQSVHWMMAPLSSGIIGKSAVVICVPFFHAFGHYSLIMAISWALRIHITDPRDMDNIAALIKKNRPFMVVGVPTHYVILSNYDFPKMTTFFYSGAAALPKEVAENFEKKVGVPMGEGYGMTECTAAATINISAISAITGFMKKTKSSIGIPIADTEIKVISQDTGEEVPFGESGELWIKGPQVMKGYWPDPGKGLTDDGWLPTGDIGKMDEDGYFHIVDRIKDMINVSGNKIYSREMDDILYEHPAVDMAGVIGIPDPDRPGSERVKVFIKLNSEYKGKTTVDEIILYCKEKFAPYAVPKFVEFRDDLPLTQAMKIFKKQLRDEEIAKMKEQGLLK